MYPRELHLYRKRQKRKAARTGANNSEKVPKKEDEKSTDNPHEVPTEAVEPAPVDVPENDGLCSFSLPLEETATAGLLEKNFENHVNMDEVLMAKLREYPFHVDILSIDDILIEVDASFQEEMLLFPKDEVTENWFRDIFSIIGAPDFLDSNVKSNGKSVPDNDS